MAFGARLHWRTRLVCFLLPLAGAVSVATPGALALPVLGHHGRWLTDPQGRVVILHGVQIDKFEPTAPIEFIDLNPANVAFISQEGFNLARVSFAFAGYEPTVGAFDQAYLASYLAFDRRLAQSRVYDQLDMMQGQYSAELNGWGFPNWMTITNGLPNGNEPFPLGYVANPAEQAAWDNFYADAPARDRVGLQQHYADALARIARQFARAPGLLGVEILNEPWPGSSAATCTTTAGCPPGGFDQTLLTDFYRRVVRAIRAADSHHLIAYEPNLLFDYGDSTGLGAVGDSNLMLAFHNYCLAYLTTPASEPSARCAPEEQTTLANASAYEQRTGVALLMNEWGNTTDTTTITRVAAEADQAMVGWSYWALEDCCNSTAAIIKDGTKPPTGPGNLRTPVLDALVRPYPQAVAGIPTGWSYTPASDTFQMTYTTRPIDGRALPAGTQTQIEIPALHYPTGYTVTAIGARVISTLDANPLLLVANRGAATASVIVVPAKHHPAAAANPVPEDCVNERARLLPVPRDSARIVSAGLYVDGGAVAKLRGRDLRHIRIPAGLANGTLIRIADLTNRGVRLASGWIIHGCQPRRRRQTDATSK